MQASVHIQHLTGGPGCVIAAQVCDGAGDVIQLSQSRDADTRRELIHRAIQFEFSEKQAAKIIDAFANRTLDLGFGARMDSDQLEYFHIFDEEIVAVVSSRHPLALRGSVKLQDLIREPMVSYTYNCGTRYWIDDVFRRFQLTPNIIQEVDTEKVMASAVASGLGVALMPRMTELSIYDVVPLTLENSELHRPMFMCWPKGETLRPVVKNFRDYIMDRVGELPS